MEDHDSLKPGFHKRPLDLTSSISLTMDTPTQVLIYKILNSSRCKQKDGTILDPTNMRTPVREFGRTKRRTRSQIYSSILAIQEQAQKQTQALSFDPENGFKQEHEVEHT